MSRNYFHYMFAHFVATSINPDHDKNEQYFMNYIALKEKFMHLKSDHIFWNENLWNDPQLEKIRKFKEQQIQWFCQMHSVKFSELDLERTHMNLHRFDQNHYWAKHRDDKALINVFYGLRCLNNFNLKITYYDPNPMDYPFNSHYIAINHTNTFTLAPGNCNISLNKVPYSFEKNPLHISTYMLKTTYYAKEKR